MSDPKVYGPKPSGENAGAALSGNASNDDPEIEDANVKEIRDSPRENPDGDASGSPAWMGVVEDLLRVGGKELFEATKNYVRQGNLSLFSRRNPEPEARTQEASRPEAPQVPPPEHFEPARGGSDAEDSRSSAPRRNNEGGKTTNPKRQQEGPGVSTVPENVKSLSQGDLARVKVGNHVVWVEVTGTADHGDDYEGRMASSGVGLSEGDPVTFSAHHLIGRVGEAPKNPEVGPPKGIVGERTRQNPSAREGPLPPRF